MNKDNTTLGKWEEILWNLSSGEFEELSMHLIKSIGSFENIDWRYGSMDGGKDILAERIEKDPAGISTITEKWWFQCKRYSKGISFEDINPSFLTSCTEKIDKFVIMSNMHLTHPCKEQIKKIQETHQCRIIDWSGPRFLEILCNNLLIFKEWFPEYEIPQMYISHNETKILQLSNKLSSELGIDFKVELKEGEIIDNEHPKESLVKILKNRCNLFEKQDPNINSFVLYHFGLLIWRLTKDIYAIELMDKCLEINPQNINALLQKSHFLEQLGKLNDAIECLDIIIKYYPENTSALNNKASYLRRKNKPEEALEIIEKVLRIDPKFIFAINNKALILKNLGKTKEAITLIDNQLTKNKDSIYLMSTKVDLLIDILDLRSAHKINNKILEKQPSNIIAINSKGVIYENNARFQHFKKYNRLALDCFENINKSQKDYAIAWANRIICLVNLKALHDADNIIEELLEEYPNSAYLLIEKAHLLELKNDFKNAYTYVKKALKIESTKKFYIKKADIELNLKKNKESMDTVDIVLKYDPEYADAWRIKGESLRRLRQKTLSNMAFKKAEKFAKTPISLLEDR